MVAGRAHDEMFSRALATFRSMFEGKKGQAWIKRCVRRLPSVRRLSVSPIMEFWVVKGDPSLGDRRRTYIVTYDKKRRTYTCSCYEAIRKYSSWRRRRTCTHVGAVILYKLINREG